MYKTPIKKAIKAFIKKNYGESEANNPSYDIDKLAAAIATAITNNKD